MLEISASVDVTQWCLNEYCWCFRVTVLIRRWHLNSQQIRWHSQRCCLRNCCQPLYAIYTLIKLVQHCCTAAHCQLIDCYLAQNLHSSAVLFMWSSVNAGLQAKLYRYRLSSKHKHQWHWLGDGKGICWHMKHLLQSSQVLVCESLEWDGVAVSAVENVPVKCVNEDKTSIDVPCAGSGVVRIDPLHFVAGCHRRQLNQDLSFFFLV